MNRYLVMHSAHELPFSVFSSCDATAYVCMHSNILQMNLFYKFFPHFRHM